MDNCTNNILPLSTEEVCSTNQKGAKSLHSTSWILQFFNSSLKRFSGGFKVSLMLLFLSFLVVDTSAQTITVDGDPSDWPAVFASGAITVKQKVVDPVNTTDDNIWTQGSSATETDIDNNWHWTMNGANDKGDITNAGIALIGEVLYFFADRYANNGDDAVGIWIFVSPVSLDPDGTFNGHHSNGDILITSHFINGGAVGDRHAYVWTDGVLVERVIADIDLSVATNQTLMPVPAGWPYEPKFPEDGDTEPYGYPANSFFEGFINLGGEEFDDLDICYSTFLIETRNSQSLDASLEDLVIGDFITRPTISVNDVTVCSGESAMFTAVANGEFPPFTYYWSENGGAYAVGTSTYTINPATATGTVSVYVVGNNGCISDTVTGDLTVVENPPCSITGDDDVCPGSTNTYSGPVGDYTYAWSVIAGSASISGSSSGQMVDVVAPASCGDYTLQLIVMAGDCSSTCQETFSATDNTDPVFSFCPADADLGCNPSSFPDATPTATDNCGTPTITGGVLGDPVNTTGCTWTRSRTWTATDACGNTSTCTQTFTYTVDVTDPVFTVCPPDADLGCNPSTFPDATPTATDDCGTPTITGGVLGDPVNTTGCTWTRSRTWTATDGCGNTATCTQTFTYTVDETDPVFTVCPPDADLGCNPSTFPSATPTATDNCGTPTITGGTLGDPVNTAGCTWTRSRTWTATDACGNSATCTQTFTYTLDVTPPTFTFCPPDAGLGCNPSTFPDATPTATDNCGTANITGGTLGDPVNTEGCTWTRSRTWTATDGCGNTSTCTQTFTYTVDVTPPTFTFCPPGGDLGCNPSGVPGPGTPTVTDNCGGTPSVSSSLGAVISDGCMRTQTRTYTATDACNNSATCTQTFFWIVDVTPPGFSSTPASVDLDCGSPIPPMPTITGTDNCAGPVVVTPGVQDVTLDCATGFSRMITRTWTAVDACLNQATYQQVIRVRCCPDVFCTYTQGYFGNDGGQACDGDGGKFGTFETIQNAIDAQGGTIYIGDMSGVNVMVTSSAADVNKVIEVLPGGGGAKTFTHAGSISITGLPGSYISKQGRLNNSLFAQTLTLSINMGITAGLGNVPLAAGQYLIVASTVECGSSTPKDCEYEWNGSEYVLTYTPYKAFGSISQGLYDALSTKNVAGLLELANAVIVGDALPDNVSLSAISSAVDMINNAFDECRLFVGLSESNDVSGYCTPPDAPPVTTSSKVDVIPGANDQSIRLQVTAFPNPAPANGSFNLQIVSNESGMATIEYFNVNGSKLTQSNRLLQANVTENVRFDGARFSRGAIMYKVSLNGKFARGVVLRLN